MLGLSVWANAGGAFGDAELRSFDLEVDYTEASGAPATLTMDNVDLGNTASFDDPRSVIFLRNGLPVSLPNVSQVRINNLGSAGGSPVFRELQGVCGDDFSDAPATYTNTSHTLDPQVMLGATNTLELTALNDDSDTGDDGITIPALAQGVTATLTAEVAGAGGYLQGWIDFNGDGDFDDAGEQVATDLQDGGTGDTNAATGSISFAVPVPADAILTQTFARFRWSTTAGLDTTMAAPDGEVEDYAVTIEPGTTPISGTVFLDNGTGAGAVPHDGLIQGDEPGEGAVTVEAVDALTGDLVSTCLLYTSPSPRDKRQSRMPSSA